MSTINQLSSVDTVQAGDQVAVYDASMGDARKAAMTVLLAYMQANLVIANTSIYTTQYAAPSATGFTVAITDADDSIHLILTPVAGYADGAITLPAVLNAIDKQEVLVNCTQAITTLVVNANGALAVTGEPASMSANDFFRLKYDLTTQTWYRVS